MTKQELIQRIENFIKEVENADSWENKDFTEDALCYLEKALKFLKED